MLSSFARAFLVVGLLQRRISSVPAFGQGFFRGTTLVEFEKYAKAFISMNSSSGSSSFRNSSKWAWWIDASWLPAHVMSVMTVRVGPKGISSRSDHGSGEKKLFLAPRWLGLRDFQEDTHNVPPTYHVVT
ncbi:hypothetical protein F2Q69_00006516 [Brassica cretica]|uniref:Secreted protein n=1 Tax=Brassica cretica TaxID=69181 RepID=A0A8S9P2A7_BRACR|nr:hypothetical protein F2Q69_00006516 [Brassica cretica]